MTAALLALALLPALLLVLALCRTAAPADPLDRLEDDLAQQAWLADVKRGVL